MGDTPTLTSTCTFDDNRGEYKCTTYLLDGFDDPTTTTRIHSEDVPPDAPPNLGTQAPEITTSASAKETVGTLTVSPSGALATPGSTQSASTVAVTSPAALSSTSKGSNGVSKGAVAGIAIGTAIIGAAIAFGIAFLLFRRRNRRGPAMGKYDSSPELVALSKPGQNTYVQVSTVPPPTTAAAAVGRRDMDSDLLAGVLPPAANDNTIQQKLSTLFDQIQLHVENFYRDVHATITPSMEGELAVFGMGSMGMAEMLQSSSQPTLAIKHALVSYVLGITSPDGDADATLFPRDVIGLSGKDQLMNNPDTSTAYSLYKRLAVHLHTSTTSTSQARQPDIREAAEHFAITFFPWVNPGYGDQEKDEDLVQIISNALDLMVWLYGQPTTFEFLWEAGGRLGTVVAPGVVKMSDETRTNAQPRVLLQPVVVFT